MFKSLLRGFNRARHTEIAERVENDLTTILALSNEEALLEATRFLQDNPHEIQVNSPRLNPEANDIPDSIAPHAKELLLRYPELHLIQPDLSITLSPFDVQLKSYKIGESKSDNYSLFIRPGAENVYIRSNGKNEDEFPSLAHFILYFSPSYEYGG